jgi:hypothetical protein
VALLLSKIQTDAAWRRGRWRIEWLAGTDIRSWEIGIVENRIGAWKLFSVSRRYQKEETDDSEEWSHVIKERYLVLDATGNGNVLRDSCD